MTVGELKEYLSKIDNDVKVYMVEPEYGVINPITCIRTAKEMVDEEIKESNGKFTEEIKANYSCFNDKDLMLRFDI